MAFLVVASTLFKPIMFARPFTLFWLLHPHFGLWNAQNDGDCRTIHTCLVVALEVDCHTDDRRRKFRTFLVFAPDLRWERNLQKSNYVTYLHFYVFSRHFRLTTASRKLGLTYRKTHFTHFLKIYTFNLKSIDSSVIDSWFYRYLICVFFPNICDKYSRLKTLTAFSRNCKSGRNPSIVLHCKPKSLTHKMSMKSSNTANARLT